MFRHGHIIRHLHTPCPAASAAYIFRKIKQALARGARLTELLKQPQFKPVPVEEQVVGLFAGVRGYLDKIEVSKVGRFESQLLSDLKSREPAIIDSIRADREIKPDTEKKLIAFLDGFTKSFA